MKYFKLCYLISILFILSNLSHAQLYGRLKVNSMTSHSTLNSFNNVNLSAATSATNMDLYAGDHGNQTTFQVAQSRIGGKYKLNKKVLILVEGDFIDFAQSSPTTSSHPRLRRAYIRHDLSDDLSVQLGQDWDLFSNLNPKTFNYVGNYFNAGNIGFMKNQLIFKKKNNGYNLSLAIAQAGKSSAPVNTELENKNRISVTAVYEKTFKNGVLQIGVVSAKRDFSNIERHIWGTSVGVNIKINKHHIISELYYGKGLNKIALLSLPNNNYENEYGGYLTHQYALNDNQYIYYGIGVAKTKSPGTSVYSTTSRSFSNLGAKSNINYKVGHVLTIDKVEYFTEITQYQTDYNKKIKATSLEIGALVYF